MGILVKAKSGLHLEHACKRPENVVEEIVAAKIQAMVQNLCVTEELLGKKYKCVHE